MAAYIDTSSLTQNPTAEFMFSCYPAMDLPLITIPPSAPHTHTIIFLHGRGDKARSFAHSLTYSITSQGLSLPQTFPSFRWVFPQAELRAYATLPGESMSQWFDVWNVQNFSEREELQAIGLRESVSVIKRIIESEAIGLGNRYDKIILAGISQGAATAVHTLLNLNIPEIQGQESRKLGAFLGFSCRMPFPGRTLKETRDVLGLEVKEGDEVLRNTPVLLEHCVDDPLVLVGNGRVLRDTLRGFGTNVTWKEYPDGGHWFNSPVGVDDAVGFLEEHVTGIAKPGGKGESDEMDVS